MFLVYGGDKELVVKGYVDASFDTDLDDSKSQTGYVYILNRGAVHGSLGGSTGSSLDEGVQNRSAKKEFLAVLQGVSIE